MGRELAISLSSSMACEGAPPPAALVRERTGGAPPPAVLVRERTGGAGTRDTAAYKACKGLERLTLDTGVIERHQVCSNAEWGV